MVANRLRIMLESIMEVVTICAMVGFTANLGSDVAWKRGFSGDA